MSELFERDGQLEQTGPLPAELLGEVDPERALRGSRSSQNGGSRSSVGVERGAGHLGRALRVAPAADREPERLVLVADPDRHGSGPEQAEQMVDRPHLPAVGAEHDDGRQHHHQVLSLLGPVADHQHEVGEIEQDAGNRRDRREEPGGSGRDRWRARRRRRRRPSGSGTASRTGRRWSSRRTTCASRRPTRPTRFRLHA